MKWYWVIPISLAIIGYFGMFWALSLSNIDINFSMDDNTREAMQSIDYQSISNIGDSINLWIAPSENWTMVTRANNELFINGEKIEQFNEPLDERGIWNRTNDVLLGVKK